MIHSTRTSHLRSVHTLLLAACLCAGSQAQLVFIPDATMRTKMNSVVPGCVDGSGYLDTQNAGVLALTTWGLAVNWDPSDLTGIENFTGLTTLTIMYWGVPTGSVLPAFPPNLTSLSVAVFPGASLPPFPPGLTSLSVSSCPQLTSIGTIPNGITDLELNSVDALTSPVNIPTAAVNIRLTGCSQVPSITDFPPTLRELRMNGALIDSLPPLPTSMDWLDITYLTQLVHIANLPDTMFGTCTLQGLPMLANFPAFPVMAAGNSVELYDLPLITNLPALPLSVTYLSFNDMPLLSELPPLPLDLIQMQLTDLPNLHCLPYFPTGFASMYIDETVGVSCVPYLTAGLAQNPEFYPPVCTTFNGGCPFYYPSVAGTFYHDVNADGVHDLGEPGLAYAHASITPGNFLAGPAPDGSYSMALDPGTYAIAPVFDNPYVVSVAPSTHSATLAIVEDADSLNDFGLVLQPDVQDLRVVLASTGAQPGFDNQVWLAYANTGTIPMDGSVSLTFDGDQSWVGAVPPPDVLAGNTATWNFTALGLGGNGLVTATLHTDAAVPLGTPLQHTAVIDPVATDMTPGDNTATDNSEVVGSFDPNDKRVLPSELTSAEVFAGEPLVYTIRFQNTGTFPAQRVVITDALSTDLQANTFHLLASSHPCTWAIGDGILKFTFEPIALPDSASDEPGSHGFVTFSVLPVSSLTNGAQVDNIASIYFDYNAPVITNEALFTVSDPEAMEEVAPAGMRLWPNPVRDVLVLSFAQAPQDAVIDVIDLAGRSVLRAGITGERVVLPVDHLAPGSYQVRTGVGVARFVKE